MSSILACFFGVKKDTDFLDIMYYDKKNYSRYKSSSLEELYEEFLHNFEDGIEKNTRTYENLIETVDLGLKLLFYPILLFLIFIAVQLLSKILG